MSRTINCDLCKGVIESEEDIRYHNITKMSKHSDKEIPDVPEKEICVFCKEKIITILANWE